MVVTREGVTYKTVSGVPLYLEWSNLLNMVALEHSGRTGTGTIFSEIFREAWKIREERVEARYRLLKKFSQLGKVYRVEPCQEYPGRYLVFTDGNDEKDCGPNLLDAYADVMRRDLDQNDIRKHSICWQASEDDPRIGEVWFTGFYRL